MTVDSKGGRLIIAEGDLRMISEVVRDLGG